VVDSAPESDRLIGEVIASRYRIEARLGDGAMGAVYRARHVKVGRPFAVKVLRPTLLGDDTIRRRFLREAELAGSLDHPNIVGMVDIGETSNGLCYLVMEYAPGATLYDLILEAAPLPVPQVIAIMRQLCDGLAHAHDRGLIHRDFKPENVVIERGDRGERLKIIDFGIAILRDEAMSSSPERLTTTGIVLGTPHYMAPEQALGDLLDHRVDLFALGVMCFEMLTGRPPFDGDGVDVARANVALDTPAMSERAPGRMFDPLLEALTRRLMSKSRDARPASAAAARALIDLIERDRPAAAAELDIVLPEVPPPRPRAATAAPTVPPPIGLGLGHGLGHARTDLDLPIAGGGTVRGHAVSVPIPMHPMQGISGHGAMPPTEAAGHGAMPPMQAAGRGAMSRAQSLRSAIAAAAGARSRAQTTIVTGPRRRRARIAALVIAPIAAFVVAAALVLAVRRPAPAPLAAAQAAAPPQTSLSAPTRSAAQPQTVAPAPSATPSHPEPPATAPSAAQPQTAAPAPDPSTARPPLGSLPSPGPGAAPPPQNSPPVAGPATRPPGAAAPHAGPFAALPRTPAPHTVSRTVHPAPAAPRGLRAPAAPALAAAPSPSPAADAAPGAPTASITAHPAPQGEEEPPAAAGAAPVTATSVAALYADVGQQLRALDQRRRAGGTTDLWRRYTLIRISEALGDPATREEASAVLLELRAQIAQRSDAGCDTAGSNATQ
jgi:tRNA A-37 threonylcarbamoyl transferase component Bud32